MTQLDCMRGPLDGLAVDIKLKPGDLVELGCVMRVARYAECGTTFGFWALVPVNVATLIATYRAETPRRLIHLRSRETTKG